MSLWRARSVGWRGLLSPSVWRVFSSGKSGGCPVVSSGLKKERKPMRPLTNEPDPSRDPAPPYPNPPKPDPPMPDPPIGR